MVIVYTIGDVVEKIKNGYSRLYQCADMILGVEESNGDKYTIDDYGYRLSGCIPDGFKEPLGDFPTNDFPLFVFILKAHGKA